MIIVIHLIQSTIVSFAAPRTGIRDSILAEFAEYCLQCGGGSIFVRDMQGRLRRRMVLRRAMANEGVGIEG